MFAPKNLRLAFVVAVSVALLLPGSLMLGQSPKKKKPKPAPPDAKPILWQEPTDIASRDLFLGPGGEEMKPDLSKITFISDETRAYSTRYRVKDGAGREWVVKIGKEAQPDTAASRLVWAAGYFTTVTYYVPKVEIEGKGTFENAIFKARTKKVKRLGIRWDWSKNPFVGTTEFQGLKVLMALVGNWDIQNHQHNILMVRDEDQKQLEYIIGDFGASFAHEGRFIGHTRNEPEAYVKSDFVKGVHSGIVKFDYKGKNQHLLNGVTVADAKWLGNILLKLSDKQISDAFRAAEYTPEQIEVLTKTVRSRIDQLVNLPE
jgi:hypothetical protein